MRVRLVCYEDVDRWIMGKFARRMLENLQLMGIEADIDKLPDDRADINHHIVFGGYDGKAHGIDTTMITHIDNIDKLRQVGSQLKVAAAGICMSKETQLYLAQMGVDKNRLCYVNPAHDGVVRIKKTVVGLSCRVQEDGRKRESFLEKLAFALDAAYFSFKIMGDGWDRQVKILRRQGFDVEYTDHFEYDRYMQLIPSLDYYLYMGMDEGQMGFIDAAAAGVKTIVTAQGYHLDAQGGIVHPFTEYQELEAIFLGIQKEKKKLVDSVATWNWYDYTKKHVEIWRYLLNGETAASNYRDGLNSLLESRGGEVATDSTYVKEKLRKLQKNKYAHFYSEKKKRLQLAYSQNGWSGIVGLMKKKLSKGRVS